MSIGSPIGQAGFRSAPVVAVQDSDLWAHARPKGSVERPRHVAPPRTDEQIQRDRDFAMHSTAQAGANRRGQSPVISAEQANAEQLARLAQRQETSATPPEQALDATALLAMADQLAQILATLTRHGIDLAKIGSRLDVLEGGGYSGDAA